MTGTSSKWSLSFLHALLENTAVLKTDPWYPHAINSFSQPCIIRMHTSKILYDITFQIFVSGGGGGGIPSQTFPVFGCYFPVKSFPSPPLVVTTNPPPPAHHHYVLSKLIFRIAKRVEDGRIGGGGGGGSVLINKLFA